MSIFSDIQLINIFRLQQPMHKLGKAPFITEGTKAGAKCYFFC